VRLLAFETATHHLSVALWQDGSCLERSEVLPNGGGERLLPWVHELLAEASVTLKQLDGVAFGAGPGGFTGLRLACGVTQGLAFGLDIPVVPVSTLQAMALVSGEAFVWVCLDARMNEIYSASYKVSDDVVTEIATPVCSGSGVSPAPTGDGCVGIGDGFAVYGDVLRARKPDMLVVRSDVYPDAAAIARVAAPVFARGEGVRAAAAQPIYVRDKVALTTVERLAQGGTK
jgi:tRNA threonylcarbamoyladenosine biosynthesis protein TsaB